MRTVTQPNVYCDTSQFGLVIRPVIEIDQTVVEHRASWLQEEGAGQSLSGTSTEPINAVP